MRFSLGFLTFLTFLFLGIAIPASVFIGIGYMMSYLLGLPLFNSTLLCIGSALVFAFALAFIHGESRLHQNSEEDLYDCPVCTYQRKMSKVKIIPVVPPKKAKKSKHL